MATTDAEKQIPKAPPGALRQRYLSLSWRYLYWCLGMLLWCLLCIVYFFSTHQPFTAWIGVTLGVMVVAMVVLPALLFGGDTWYKRLAWMVILLCLFALMFFYPSVAAILGVRQRLASRPYFTRLDIWQFSISGVTLLLHIWTLRLTFPAIRLARQLARGDYWPDIDSTKK